MMDWHHYIWVFIGSFFVDVVPFPLPPAFTVMIFLQIKFGLNVWVVIAVGVMGSVFGRYLLTLYIPKISSRIFRPSKNEDLHFLGSRLKQKGWKSQAMILLYSLMPLPTTPLFLAGGMARIKPLYIIPSFLIGKLVSDSIAVWSGRYAAENTYDLIHGLISWKSASGLAIGLLLVFALLFVDWRTFLVQKKLKLRFNIWKKLSHPVK